MPIGAIVSTRDVAKTFTPGSHGTTFGGNPLACAAGKAVIETIKEEGLVERSAELGSRWKRSIQKIADEKGGVKEVRGMGLMIGIEIGARSKGYKELCFKDGLLVNVAGGNSIRLVPPLIISQGSVELFDRTLGGFLS
jgi:acetylornithine/succinyldiaminopimelate/putrescine aminotransferase